MGNIPTNLCPATFNAAADVGLSFNNLADPVVVIGKLALDLNRQFAVFFNIDLDDGSGLVRSPTLADLEQFLTKQEENVHAQLSKMGVSKCANSCLIPNTQREIYNGFLQSCSLIIRDPSYLIATLEEYESEDPLVQQAIIDKKTQLKQRLVAIRDHLLAELRTQCKPAVHVANKPILC